MNLELLKEIGFEPINFFKLFNYSELIEVEKEVDSLAILIHNYNKDAFNKEKYQCFYYLAKLSGSLYALYLSDHIADLNTIKYRGVLEVKIESSEFIGINTTIDDLVKVYPELTKTLMPSLYSKSANKVN